MGFFRAVFVTALFAWGAAAQWPEAPTIKVDVRLVRMLTTVRGPQGELVGGLNAEDFRIFDNGVEQTLKVFERQSSQPLSVALLVDISGSTGKESRYEIDSMHRFLKALINEGNPNDTAALYSFNESVTQVADFTRRLDRLDIGLRSLHSHGATALYDALYLASHQLERREGRHVVVAVTDGGDTISHTNFQGALEALHRANAVLYSTVVIPVEGGAGRNLGGENALITLSGWTGGRPFFPAEGPAIDTVFGDILKDLRTQYLLAYYPTNLPPTRERFHKVQVEVKRPAHSVSARNGYYSDIVEPTPVPRSQQGPRPER